VEAQVAIYVWRDGKLVDKKTGEILSYDPKAPPCSPAMHSFKSYVSPASGKVIEDASAQREDLKATGSRAVSYNETRR
jgi:hypothetical protein